MIGRLRCSGAPILGKIKDLGARNWIALRLGGFRHSYSMNISHSYTVGAGFNRPLPVYQSSLIHVSCRFTIHLSTVMKAYLYFVCWLLLISFKTFFSGRRNTMPANSSALATVSICALSHHKHFSVCEYQLYSEPTGTENQPL